MTRQDYELIAKAFAAIEITIARHDSASRSSREATSIAKAHFLSELIAAFQRDNPKFDIAKFKSAIARESQAIIETPF